MSDQEIDARQWDSFTDKHVAFFRDNGYLIVRNFVGNEELSELQKDTYEFLKKGEKGPEYVEHDPEYRYRKGSDGNRVLFEVGSGVARCKSLKILLGNPFMLRSIEKILGPNFLPIIEEVFYKMPNNAVLVPWHRDVELPDNWSSLPQGGKTSMNISLTERKVNFNVDVYLDESNLDTCLWVIPGSNKWSTEDARKRCSEPEFRTSDAIPVPLKAGDAIFHDVLVLHGSPAGNGNKLRRTQYYGFQSIEEAFVESGHTLQYITNRQMVLIDCINRRTESKHGSGETPFRYAPENEFAIAEVFKPYTYSWPDERFLIKE